MSNEENIAHTKWECKYHIVFILKGRSLSVRRRGMYRRDRKGWKRNEFLTQLLQGMNMGNPFWEIGKQVRHYFICSFCKKIKIPIRFPFFIRNEVTDSS